VVYALGLEPPLRKWAAQHGATHLLGAGGQEFVDRLDAILADEESEYWWRWDGIDLSCTRNVIGLWERNDVAACGFTNWEIIRFATAPYVWDRTTWWLYGVEIDNPLENFL
jgi:hypothetical protein